MTKTFTLKELINLNKEHNALYGYFFNQLIGDLDETIDYSVNMGNNINE